MEKIYKLGKLVFALSGDDPVLPHLQEELKSIELKETVKPSLIFRFGNVQKEMLDGVHVSPVVCTEKEIIYSGYGFSYRVVDESGIKVVSIRSNAIKGKKRLFPGLAKIKDWNFLLPTEQLAKTFMYDVFDYLTQIENLKVGQSYMHASSFTKGDRAVAIVAWGGIGKTTSMLKLVSEDNWNFLSDDLGLIDVNGHIYRSPKKMQIYAYNVEGQPAFEKMLLGGRSIADIFNWYYRKRMYGIKGVRRRVSAEELFKEKVGKSAKLTDVFFIERAAVAEFQSEPIGVNELTCKAASTVMSEIEPFHKIAAAIYSVQNTSVIPSYEEVFNGTKKLLHQSFSTTSPLLIRIPLKASPDQLADYLRELMK
jgi:hypothetical protein